MRLKSGKHIERRAAVERFITVYCLEHGGQFPKLREISGNFGLSTSVIYALVQELIREGKISCKDKKHWLTAMPPILNRED